ncbi:hypothetical protein EMGBS4_04640 [Acidimicrobiaceae bacterium]|nr:hypothetical protein EMGBS4_04640 [Acidimicrobiaceae bacterium]
MLTSERENGSLIVDIRPVEQRQRDGDLPGAIVMTAMFSNGDSTRVANIEYHK